MSALNLTHCINYEAELNTEQFQAITSPPGPLLVIAGAGSGKTRALTYRVAWLVEQGVQPHNILLLTFTNKAAKEMLERANHLLPCDISKLWGGTFHHIGHRILRRHINPSGFNADFTILDRDDSVSLLKSCMEEAGVNTKDKKFPKPDVIIQAISLAINTRKGTSAILSAQFQHLAEFSERILSLEQAYQRKKQDTNAVDYDDLLLMPLEILKKDEALLSRYQEQFQHILVDEYQDTNAIQAELVDLLGARHHQIMVVGDDAQSIYSWRGANFANIMSFPKRHPGAKIIRLETNYRSIPEILTLANISIAQNTEQFPKNLRATRPNGVKPARIEVEDGYHQAAFVAQRIMEVMEEYDGDLQLSDIAVLYRAHFHSMELQMELTRRKIPFQVTSGLRFFEQAHIKDIASYLRFFINPRDEISFKRIALLMPGVGQRTASKMWEQLSNGAAWNDVRPPEKAVQAWAQWAEMNKQLQESGGRPAKLIRLVMDAVYEDHLKMTYTNFINRLDDIYQLQNFAADFTETSEFLSQLALMTNVEAESDVAGNKNEGVRLTSIHQAKGLEFKVVFVLMLCEGMFPSFRSLESKDELEEERRLFYVAITRAKDELYLTHPRVVRRMGSQSDSYQSPSRFLEEFPRELCNTWRFQMPLGQGSGKIQAVGRF
ncbi:MAG: ATP-dependent helicase [bacterium]